MNVKQVYSEWDDISTSTSTLLISLCQTDDSVDVWGNTCNINL